MKLSILLLTLFSLHHIAVGQTDFPRFFSDQTMRVDYYSTGIKGEERLSLDNVYAEGAWAGSRINLIDTLNLGEYQFRVFDVATSKLMYSRGYSTMFNEWQTTDEASAGIWRTFSQTVRFPFPKRPIQLVICRRDKRMIFHEVFSCTIDPLDATLVNREKRTPNYAVTKLMYNGDPSNKVDILIIGDGYAKSDIQKFREDAKHFNDVMFATTPFKERKSDFNVWTIEVISEESGIDIPDKNIWKKTALGTMYNTFGSARYVLTDANKELRDIAAAAPYDFINILINDKRYGGGGIFNLYTTTFTISDQPGQEWQRDYVYVHEFGHSFGGLGDEYYTSSTGYTDFYPKGVEPWEPNITATPNARSIKWKSSIDGTFPIPTPWRKTAYDSLEALRGKLDRLASDYYEKREPLLKASETIIKEASLLGKVGAFEGAGYVSQGLFRPSLDCRMFSLSLVDFDPVCRASIERMIDFYSK